MSDTGLFGLGKISELKITCISYATQNHQNVIAYLHLQ